MNYLLIKSLHVCAIVLWLAGMVLQLLARRLGGSVSATIPAPELELLQTFRQWDRRVTAPCMLLAWITGLLLAYQGGWFGHRWLLLKLTLVIALAALHGRLAGQLRRRLESGTTSTDAALNPSLAALILLMAGIVLLVIVKPL